MEDATVTCPHCWQEIMLEIDVSVSAQDYVEDCPVCCRPMRVLCQCEPGRLTAITVEATD